MEKNKLMISGCNRTTAIALFHIASIGLLVILGSQSGNVVSPQAQNHILKIDRDGDAPRPAYQGLQFLDESELPVLIWTEKFKDVKYI